MQFILKTGKIYNIVLNFTINFSIIIVLKFKYGGIDMKIKRITALLLSLLLIVGVFPVSAFAAERTQFGMIDELEDLGNRNFVRDHEAVLETIYEGLMAHSSSINISEYSVTPDDLGKIFSAVIGIYPEIFFVDRRCSYTRDGNHICEFIPIYLNTADEMAAMLGEFYAKADEYLKYVNDDMDDFTKAVVLHDQLALQNSYCIEKDGVQSTNYTFMVEGWGRCENYTECYAYLLAQVGIKSEIVNSDQMVHEWMRINLDGDDFYYNVDLTWDDPTVNDADRPGMVSHSYFLLSDEEFQRVDPDTGRLDTHYDYNYINKTDTGYDDYDNLHSFDYPIFNVNNKLYTLYKANNKGYIVAYDHSFDQFGTAHEINDVWHADPDSTWNGNFSGIGEYDGLLYFNGENCAYTYDPTTGIALSYIDLPLADGRNLYGLYIKDGMIIGRAAETPNNELEDVELGPCKKRYNIILEEDYIHGTVTVDRQSAFAGELFYINVVPDEGYVISSVWCNDTKIFPDSHGDCLFEMPAENVVISALFDFEDNVGARLLGHSISLQGDIGVNFYMELSDAVANDPDAYMHFTIPSGDQTFAEDVLVKGAERDGNYYVFKCSVAAKDMDSTIYAQLNNGEPIGTIYEYSVKQYADYLIDNADDDHPEYQRAKPLVEAMLEYGRHAYVYFNNDEADEALNTTVPVKGSSVENMPAGVEFDGATLSLKSQTTLSLYFVKENGAADVELTMDGMTEGVEYETEHKGNEYVIRIRNISAAELNDDFTVTVNGTGSVTYSPMTYCYKAQTSSDAKLANTVKALYLYWVEAGKYFV